MAGAAPAGGDGVVQFWGSISWRSGAVDGGGHGGGDGRSGVAKAHFLLVDAGDGFLEKGGAGDGRWSPDCVAAGAGVGEGLGRWGGGGRDVEDGWWGEGEEVVSPFL